MEAENYAKLTGIEDDVILAKLGELQTEWDERETERDDHNEDMKEARAARDVVAEKMHKIVRAHDNGEPIFLLIDGKLTVEKPDDPGLFHKDAEEPQPHGEAPDPEAQKVLDI